MNNWVYEEEKPPVPEYIQAIVEIANARYHMVTCHPTWVKHWDWIMAHPQLVPPRREVIPNSPESPLDEDPEQEDNS